MLEVLVQRGFFITDNACDDVFARPLELGDQTSLTHLNALMYELGFLNLDLQKLSSSYGEVCLHFNIDGPPTVELVDDYIRELVNPLGNVIVCDNTSCMMHALNRIVADHTMRADSKFDMSGIISLSLLMHLGMYFDKFVRSVKEVATEDFDWEQYGLTDADNCGVGRRAVELCLHDLKDTPHKLASVNAAWRTSMASGIYHGSATVAESRTAGLVVHPGVRPKLESGRQL